MKIVLNRPSLQPLSKSFRKDVLTEYPDQSHRRRGCGNGSANAVISAAVRADDVQFSQFKDGIYALGKNGPRYILSLRSSPNTAFKTVPMFVSVASDSRRWDSP